MRQACAARRVLGTALLLGALLLAPGPPARAGSHPSAQAGSLRSCDQPLTLSAAQQDTLFRFSALIKAELEASGQRLALVSRSGLDLSRFQQRYSHAGISLQASANTPWSVRQLYYACDEGRPRLYDQGLAGFVSGTDDAMLGYVSVLLLPPGDAAALERVALDNAQALQLLGAAYSANAHAFSTLYQNCNQWLVELLALAWGAAADQAEGPARPRAQRWLQDQGYAATRIDVGSRLWLWLGAMLPWLHSDDHPPEDLARLSLQVSMPASIEAFVQARVPGAQRIEFCHRGPQVVVHRGWSPIAEGCQPGPGDAVITLD
ncbi:DUF2145 domain-containing protein [Aquabacterium sp.]|uniref:DUF2145 domain-containing protein n=1 Tax=Aquabacterium sp. TaxID=1872578 RepID=UPI002BF74B78|nr:DUF2145 domain-containing protein [Aquabacterium sp.]HSW05021.1 DUF2145 domain-containing protein [Aquabacterium sp.]